MAIARSGSLLELHRVVTEGNDMGTIINVRVHVFVVCILIS